MATLRPRRLAVVLATAGLGVLLVAGPATAQVPPLPSEIPTELPTGEPEPEPAPEPSPTPSPTPSEQPSDRPSEQPTQEPDPDVAGQPGEQPSDGPSGGEGSLPGFEIFVPTTSDPVPPGSGQAPQVAPGRSSDAGSVTGGAPGPGGSVTTAGVSRVAAALPGTFGIGLLAALMGVATIFGTFTLTQRGLLLATDADGGTDVETTRRWRVMAGVTLLAAAALVGIIGYLKISLETLVPVQMVYMASAGFGVIVLAAAGGALLISEQLRADEKRLTEIESALATIAEHLRPAVSDAPRLLDRSGANGSSHDDDTDDVEATRVIATGAARKPAGKRSAGKR